MGILDKIKRVAGTVAQTVGSNLLDNSQPESEQEKTPSVSAISGIYDAQLEKLIEISLLDGDLSEKERQILFKKAESLNIDRDEFEMVLDARLQELQCSDKKNRPVDATSTSIAPTMQNLIYVLSKVEDEIRQKDEKKQKSFFSSVKGIGGVIGGTLIGGIPVVGGIADAIFDFSDLDNDSSEVNIDYKVKAAKKKIILEFPLPINRDDIIDFLSYAVPLAKKRGGFFSGSQNDEHNEFVPVWKTKCEQIIAKVRLLDDAQLLSTVTKLTVEL